MSEIISFIILSLILTYAYKKLHKYWVRFSRLNSKHNSKRSKTNRNMGTNRGTNSGSWKQSLLSRFSSEEDFSHTSDGRIILPSNNPNELPPLPRFPLSGRASKPASKTNRRLSPWGGAIGEDYDG